jgi:ParB family transcriptional regulator, chromosome partitioning protein
VADRQIGMGRGLAALLSVSSREDVEELRQVDVNLITANPHQPRQSFEEDALLALADSIRARGVLQPVLVRPLPDGRYELIAGERRWRAARIAELETIPAIVRRHDDAASLEIALIENMAREDLNPVEQARACAALVEELGLTREEVGLRVGRSRVSVSNLIRLLDLPDEALELIERGALSEGHGRALLLVQDHSQRRSLARSAVHSGWSVRELESRTRSAGDSRSGPRPARRPSSHDPHPDQVATAAEIEDTLASLFGREVSVTPSRDGAYKVALSIDSLEDALELGRRLRIRAAA